MGEQEGKEDSKKTDDKDSKEDKDPKDGKDGSENKDQGKEENKDADQDEGKPKKPPIYKKPAFIITVSIITVILLVGGIIAWLILRQYVTTDDAFIDGHVIQISPQVSAQVKALHVIDNQLIRQGDLLLELDPTDYEVALQQSKAQVSEAEGRLEQARAQIASANAAVLQAEAQEHSSQASLQNASNDWRRYERVDARARSQQQYDAAGTSLTNALSRVEESKAQVTSANANVTTSKASVQAAEGELLTAQAGVKRAEVNLSYCRIAAPCDGRVTERTVEAGNYVVTGQALFMLVDPNVWVTANFKETQLTLVRPGQNVSFKVDAFPNVKFHGHIDSIQAGSGSRFSVLPAENATGNYVKIVQRVPVKILFEHDGNTNDAPMLSPGLSVVPWVKVR